MVRSTPSLLVLIAALAACSPVLAADPNDWAADDSGPGALRSSLSTEPNDWTGLGAEDDGLRFEFGTRYYYSMGNQSFAINSGLAGDHGTMVEQDTSQLLEAHMRVDDAQTHTYAKAVAGLAYKIDGSSDDNSGTTTLTNGTVNYLGADLGYTILGDTKTYALSPFVGYMYWNDSPNNYSDNYTTAKSAADISYDPSTGQTSFGGESTVNDIAAHMLRLGVNASADMGLFDISAEVAAVPYAKIDGTLGAGSGASSGGFVSYDNSSTAGPHGLTGAYNIHDIQSSATTIDGWGYGGAAEAMIGFHPTENWVFRFGGRATYVQGTVDAKFSRAQIGDPTDSNQPVAGDPGPPVVPDQLNSPNFDTAPSFSNQQYITRANPFSMIRYGLLAEITYKF